MMELEQLDVTEQEAAYRRAEGALWEHFAGAVPRERYVTLDGLGVRVRVLEHGEGPPLVFLHGGPNAASTWAPLAARLAGFRCLLPDRPGCGLSEAMDEPPARVRPFVARQLLETLDALELDEVRVVASSFGSFSALAAALERPGRIVRMVHMGCPGLVPGAWPPPRFLFQAIPGVRSLFVKREPPSDELSVRALARVGHGALVERGVAPPFVRWYTELLRSTRTRENDLALYGRIRPRDLLWWRELGRIETPMSFYWGAQDTFGGPRTARRLVRHLPLATLEIAEQSGHLPWLDDPERAAAHVRRAMAA